MSASSQEKKQLASAQRVLNHLGEVLDIPISVELWDGSRVPLGTSEKSPYALFIKSSKTISTLLRKPTLENLLRHYAKGHIGLSGGDIYTVIDYARKHNPKKKWKKLKKRLLVTETIPFLFGPSEKLDLKGAFQNDEIGVAESKRNNTDYIQFHYDVGNDFYKLFLDNEMQYSCAYFKKEDNTIHQAQLDKLEHTCRKLRLKEGETLLDIGSGWGGLICYAAKHFGVKAHGITLSKEQLAYTQEKIKKEGLVDKVSVELRDYRDMEGTFDKVVSVGMMEHIGRQNIEGYFSKMNMLLRDRGILLNHAISRRAKRSDKKFNHVRPERRLLQKYIFPGIAMDHIGHSLEKMEVKGFEIKDVESLREHYALTCKHWAQRLEANRDKAIEYVGEEKYRLWLVYLAAVSLGFADGNTNIYQTVAVKRKKGLSGMPLTREDLYR